MLTQKTRYSMLALTRLAKEYGKGTLSINQIAESEVGLSLSSFYIFG